MREFSHRRVLSVNPRMAAFIAAVISALIPRAHDDPATDLSSTPVWLGIGCIFAVIKSLLLATDLLFAAIPNTFARSSERPSKSPINSYAAARSSPAEARLALEAALRIAWKQAGAAAAGINSTASSVTA
jgi:Na+-transporting methylmalonyl-CoA/oxaloacetate decarboxylase gamma subunit